MNLIRSFIDGQFPFLKRNNAKSYFVNGERAKRVSKAQINQYFSWLNDEFFRGHLKKYKLKVNKIEIDEDNEHSTDKLLVEIKKPLESPAEDLPISMYTQKELCHMSDHAFQSFTNAGANFPSQRFIKDCRSHLNSEFKFIPNSMGKYIHIQC